MCLRVWGRAGGSSLVCLRGGSGVGGVMCRRAGVFSTPGRLYGTNNDVGYNQLHQLQLVIRGPMATIRQKLLTNDIPEYQSLNKLLKEQSCVLLDQFIESIDQEMMTFLDLPQKLLITNQISLVDFINPRKEKLAPIIYLIHLNRFPQQFGQYYNITTKDELLQLILTKLVYKHQIQSEILEIRKISSKIDLSNPSQWFPEARKMKRQIIMHVGPTNSGKTYNSLKKLTQSKSGYYAGPLRLLAREVFETFNKRHINCNLVTGEEIIPSIDDNGKISEITSGTIEMIPLFKKMDLCIIDEIQMIADDKRGEAWTNALLGVQANEIHLCGEESALELIKRIVAITGDSLQVNKYDRLGKLTVCDTPIKSYKQLKKGDCVVAFSKRKILDIKCEIEKITKLKVGVVYGALPPEIRSKEANGFNSGDYDVLVASDAIGMGLNLAIKRIVFSTTRKFNGLDMESLSPSLTKQIGGRAGRFSHDKSNAGGFVTAMNSKDLRYVKKMMSKPNKELEKACIWPTNEIWTTYISQFHEKVSILDILLNFEQDNEQLKLDNFFLTDLNVRYQVLELFMKNDIHKKLTVEDQLKLSIAPINLNKASVMADKVTFDYVMNIIKNQSKSVFDFQFLPLEILKSPPKKFLPSEKTLQVLQTLEDSHKLVLLFMWLSQRWPTLFVDKESANDWKTLIEKRISEELMNLKKSNKSSVKGKKPPQSFS